MDVLITGAAGFIGRALVARLLAGASLRDGDGQPLRPSRLILADLVVPAASSFPRGGGDAPELVRCEGDLSDPDFVATLVGPGTACVFHLAGVVSGAAETDFERGLRVNLDGSRALFDALRADRMINHTVRVVHASSIAVYGQPLPTRIDDATQPWPTLSYGAQKLACELLIGDLSRRGLIDGRSVRLSGVLVRPPVPNGALSGFNSDLIREPLAGRPVVVPVSPEATIWIQSLSCTVSNLLHAMNLDASALGAQRAVLLPALAVSVGEIVDAIGAVAGAEAKRLVSYRPDPSIEPMFGRWPAPFVATRGVELGFASDPDVASIVRAQAAAAGARPAPLR